MSRILNDISVAYKGRIEDLSGRKDPAAIKAVAKEMEAMFAYEMVKAMRHTVDTSSKNNFGGETYTAMFDMELSKVLAERGLGMQEMISRALTREAEKSEVKTEGGTPGVSKKLSPVDSLNPVNSGLGPLPVNGQVSSGFGPRKHPVSGYSQFHHGMDIAAPFGKEIHPIRDGEVTFSGVQPGYGNVVIVDHGSGLVSKYAHNSLNLVKEGDKVDSKTVIARVGSTGYSTGPHLHLEVRDNGKSVDPAGFIARV